MPMGDFILAEGWAGPIWRSLRRSHVCMYSIRSSMFFFSFFFFLQSGLHTSSNIHPIAPCAILFLSCSYPVPQAHSNFHCRSHSSGAIFLLYIPHSQGAAIPITLDGRFIDWMSCLSQGIENRVGRLASEKYLSLDRLILELALKVIISVILSSM